MYLIRISNNANTRSKYLCNLYKKIRYALIVQQLHSIIDVEIQICYKIKTYYLI